MMLTALRRICLSVVLCSGSGLATTFPLQILLEGSSEGEELSVSVPVPSLQTAIGPTPKPHPTHVDSALLGQMADFVQENLLLILLASGILLVIVLVMCGAVFMSRKRKVNAYYPASFPSKMYVDHRDKSGGARTFNEVPEKPSRVQDSEPTDSSRQLQADIMRAAKSLRTPNKSPGEDDGKGSNLKRADESPEDGPEGDCATPCKLSEGECVTLAIATSAERHSEEAAQRDVHSDSDETPCDPGPSQHPHSDSNTVQLVTGQITAF